MSTRINLWRALARKPRILLENSDFTVTSFTTAVSIFKLQTVSDI